MELSQYIYTSNCTSAMTPEMAYDMSCKSVSICEQLGITGRVFANRQDAFAMTEGPTEIVDRYFQAVKSDSFVETIVLHVSRKIETREFTDYSVWLNVGVPFNFEGKVRRLTPGTARIALPPNPSPRLRVMVEAYMNDYLTDYAIAG